jgi:hypothetical protein
MAEYNEVAKRAYELWEKAGKPPGQDAQHWLQAEAELTRPESKRGLKAMAGSELKTSKPKRA